MFRNSSAVPAGRRRAGGARLLTVLLGVLSGSCSGGSGSDPSPITNTPPVVQSVTVAAPRVEAGEEIQLTAVVQDAETPVGQLTYVWSASPSAGTIVGSGASVRWRAPKPATTPDTYTLTLTVTETYGSGSSQKTNQASGSTQVRYNDSAAEIQNIATTFLTEFTMDAIAADTCVRNFSGTGSCGVEKIKERNDVQAVRDQFNSIPPPTLGSWAVQQNTARTFADVTAACTFRSVRKSTGLTETSTGTCIMTAVYEEFRWWLCLSNFSGTSTGPSWLRWAHP